VMSCIDARAIYQTSAIQINEPAENAGLD